MPNHTLITFQINATSVVNRNQTHRYNYNKGECEKMNKIFYIDWDRELDSRVVQEQWDSFIKRFEKAVEECIHIKAVRGNEKNKETKGHC